VVPAPPPVRHTLTRRSWLIVVAVSALLGAVVGAAIGAAAALGSQQTVIEKYFPNQSVLVKPVDIQEILARVEPAVVSIDTTVAASGSGNTGGLVEGAGSGMIITPGGEVLTNNHVVAGATTVTVTLFGQTTARTAHVIGTDPAKDLALVQIDGAANLPTVVLGNSDDAVVGDAVLTIGNALALAGGPTVTQGIISAKGRSLDAQSDVTGLSEHLTGLLQTDAAINPGNSGGPLVDAQGQVIGMNTAVAESGSGNAPAQNVNLAIPINSVRSELDSLSRGGPGGPNGGVAPAKRGPARAFLGVVAETVTPDLVQADHLAVTSGALVIGLSSGGPAERAGIQVGDVIVELGGLPVNSVTDLSTALGHHAPGQTVPVTVARGPNRLTVSVTLGSTA
jgi:S1-C subfamily serine protease